MGMNTKGCGNYIQLYEPPGEYLKVFLRLTMVDCIVVQSVEVYQNANIFIALSDCINFSALHTYQRLL